MPNESKAAMEYEAGDPLCCCEYVTDAGEKSHVLAMFCDCQDFDECCDRFFKGEGVQRRKLRQVLEVIIDRIRIPTFFGAGAKRMDRLCDTTALPPVVVVPLWLYIAAFHPVLTLLSFVLVPLCVLLYYITVLSHRNRTQFFMSWGLMSTLYIYWVFIQYVLPFDHVSAPQTAGISMTFVAMLAAFFASKHGPGTVTSIRKKRDSSTDVFIVAGGTEDDDERRLRSDSDSLQRRVNAPEAISIGENGSVIASNLNQESAKPDTFSNDGSVKPLLDSDEWCHQCKLHRPQRAGHCPICQQCVLRLDHHCVWIDSCVGEENHRSFLLSVLLFVIGSFWGSILAFKSLFPRWTSELPDVWSVYKNPSLAVIFVSMCYAVLAGSFMTSMLMIQFHNITHNWTSRERRLLSRRPGYRERLAEQDKGFCQNWMNFIIMQRSRLRKHTQDV